MSDNSFLLYTAALAISGLLMVIVAALPIRQGVLSRLLSGAFGIGFLGYAFYLFFIFDGGVVQIFFYAFLAPFFFIAQAVKAYAAKRDAADAAAHAEDGGVHARQ